MNTVNNVKTKKIQKIYKNIKLNKNNSATKSLARDVTVPFMQPCKHLLPSTNPLAHINTHMPTSYINNSITV